MDRKLVYAKTPTGDEAVRQRTRVVQRNLRMVLVQVDGKLSVQELSAKIGNPVLVENALLELEQGGFIAPTAVAMSVWKDASKQPPRKPQLSALSQFSTFGSKAAESAEPSLLSEASRFSAFGKPLMGETKREPVFSASTEPKPQARHEAAPDKPPSQLNISGKSVLIAALGIPLLVGFGALLYPYARHKPAIEAAISSYAKAPVTVGDVALSIWPKPQLVLSQVTLDGDLQISEVRVDRPHQLLGGSPHHLTSVSLVQPAIPVTRLLTLPALNPDFGPFSGLTVGQVRLSGASIFAMPGAALNDIEGELRFSGNGKLEKASLQSGDRSLLIEAKPGADGLELHIEGRAWKPAGNTMSFDALQATGTLARNRLSVRNIDTSFLGGLLKGQWQLDWSSALNMSGEAQLIQIDSRRLTAALAPSLKLEGDFGGLLRLWGAGNDWPTVWRNTEATVDMSITRGLLTGLDLGEALRRGAGATVRGGATKFDQMRGQLQISPGRVSGQNLLMDAGMVTAGGEFVANTGGTVSGAALVTMQTSVSTVRLPVRISGTLPDLDAASSK
ncbi:AsmA-like C-terminal region-containing protein [Dechloromonas sp.]|uniref:AsmA-like C-terminal region-containing protein n=1 Tax=Dechloromonas sp. TaxID=1917218 RepID=UPI001222E688|nr:AsmA-like C-terminal region-containing protein [Dechloromonas sp.]MBU3697099.1 hypothetical protein [Dechloromonas sp.]TEX49095.1 MAG: hypothetical protein CFR70_04115 [Rhodocyclaceae bacterium]